MVNIRQSIAVLIVGVFGSTLAYAVFFDGKFSNGATLPAAAIAGALMAAVGGALALLWWMRRRQPPAKVHETAVDYDTLWIAIVSLGVPTQVLAIGAEVALGAPSGWLMPLIAVVVYAGLIVWLSRRSPTANARPNS